MKTFFLLSLAYCLFVAVLGWEWSHPHYKHRDYKNKVEELEKKCDHLFEQIDGLNENVCGNGAEEVELCTLHDSFTKYARCIARPANGGTIRKSVRSHYEKKLRNRPCIAVGATGMNYMCGADFELTPKGTQTDCFHLEAKSDDLFAPSMVRADYFNCPGALNFHHKFHY